MDDTDLDLYYLNQEDEEAWGRYLENMARLFITHQLDYLDDVREDFCEAMPTLLY